MQTVPLDSIAQEALVELASEREADYLLLESIGDAYAEVARNLEALAEAVGVAIAFDESLPSGVPGIRVPGLAILRPHPDEARVMVVGAHEVSHDKVRDMGIGHLHSDVWVLTMCLLMPRKIASRYRCARSLAQACGVPLWAARWRMGTRAIWNAAENLRQLY